MSAETTVTVSRTDEGRYTAVDAETGAFGEGDSKIDALTDLLELLRAIQRVESTNANLEVVGRTAEQSTPTESEADPVDRYERLSSRVQERFRDEDVDEAVVEDAIEWARSQ